MIYIKPPSREWLYSLGEFFRDIRSAEALGEGVEVMRSFLEDARKTGLDNLVTHISAEFTRLFRGVRLGYSPMPPYESAYREGICWGSSTFDVLAEYRRFGLTPESSLEGEPPDHISFELDFMRFLCNKEAEAWRRGDEGEAKRLLEAEESFLTNHILRWLSELCNKVREFDRLGFHRGWANITEGWIHVDLQQIRHTRNRLAYIQGVSGP